VDERESYISAAADANVARKFGDIKDINMNDVASPNWNISKRGLCDLGKLLNSVVRLLRCLFLRLAESCLQGEKR
jgi:hypothetical protein